MPTLTERITAATVALEEGVTNLLSAIATSLGHSNTASEKADEAAASADLASDKADEASASATFSNTKAVEAAASAAAAALIAAGLVYKGTVAGNAVPATSTAAGDFFVITTAGTSQSKTWGLLDLAIYKGTSGQWDQVQYASVTGSYVDPIAASRSAGWPSFFFDGVTNDQRVFWPIGAAGNIGVSDFTVVVPIRSLNRRAGAISGLFVLTSSTFGNYTAQSFFAYLDSAGRLRIQVGDDVNNRFVLVPEASFYALYQGRTGDLVVRRSAGVISVDWVEGRTVTAITLPAASTNGTAPAWGSDINATFLTLGSAFTGAHYSGELGAPELINRAWTTADLTFWAQHRLLPPRDRLLGGGSAVPLYASNFSAGVNGWATTSGTLDGNQDGVSDGVTSRDDCLRFFASAGNTTHGAVIFPSGLFTGRRILVTGEYYIPAGQTAVNAIEFQTPNVTASGQLSTVGTWSNFSFESVSGGDSFNLYLKNNSNYVFVGANSASDDRAFVRNIRVTPLGAVLQSEITRTAQSLDHGLNRIRGIMTSGVRPLCDRDSVPIRGNIAATGNILGLGTTSPLWFEPALIKRIRVKPTASASTTITARLNTSGGTTVGTVTTSTLNQWVDLPFSAGTAFEVSAGDKLHLTTTAAFDFEIDWSRR